MVLHVLLVVGAVLVGAPVASASSTLKWSGEAAKTSRGWDNASNWEAGVIPSSSEPVALEFPTLTSANCTSSPPTDTCYESENDVNGLDVESLQVEDSQTYLIAGKQIALGGGGLTVAPTTKTTAQTGSILAMPIALGVAQTWNIAGQNGDKAIDGNQFVLLEEVSGAGHSLNVKLSEGGGLVLANEDELGSLSLEGAEASRAGIFNGVIELFGAQLNASDHEPVSFDHIFVIGTGATGPLTTDAASIVVEPGEKKAERLEVQGATLDPESLLTFAVTENLGTVAGREYAQLASTGAVSLNGAELAVAAEDSCKALTPGTTYTFVTSTDGIVGSFGNASEGQEIPVEFPKGCTIAQTLKIHYERSGATQAVTGTVVVRATSTTLEASPAHPVTNQSVTLTATVRASAETPSGKVEFDDGGQPISGCAGQPLVALGSTYTAVCQTSFAASGSPQQLSAQFLPGQGVNMESSSTTDELAVGLGPTTTSLQVSPSTTSVEQSVSYTATVSPVDSGLVQPGGSVQFADGGAAIDSCSAQPLQQASSSLLTATCLLSYPSQSTHSITASYSGDANFAGSLSSVQPLIVQAPTSQPTLEIPSPSIEFPGEEAAPADARLDGTNIPVHARTVAVVKLACTGGSTSCEGKLSLSVREAVKGKHGKKSSRAIEIGSAAFSIATGKTAGVEVHLDATGRAFLASHRGQINASLQLVQDSESTQTSVHLAETKPGSKKKG